MKTKINPKFTGNQEVIEDVTEQLVDGFRKAISAINNPSAANLYFDFEASDIKLVRKKLGITQTGLANLMDVDSSTIKQWEQGLRQPKACNRIVLSAIKKAADEKSA